jgi:hypothetical protein
MDLPTAVAGNTATWNNLAGVAGRSAVITREPLPTDVARFRPIRIHADVVDRRGATPARDVSLRPLAVQDAEEWDAMKEASFEGGHLSALAFGGPDHPWNLIPLTKGSNGGRGTWGDIEAQVVLRLGTLAGGSWVRIELDLSYSDVRSPVVPARVRGRVFVTNALGGVANAIAIDTAIREPADVLTLTPVISTLFRDIEAEASATYGITSTAASPSAALDAIDKPTAAAQLLRNRIRQVVHLVDYPVGGVARKGKTKQYLTVQRKLVFLYNRYRNKGLLMAEDEQNLGFIVREWQAQLDHIRPKGGRYYKNFMVLHHRTNVKKGNRRVGTGGRLVRSAKMKNPFYRG